MPNTPYVDLACCNLCEACIEICPEVFSINPQTGLLEVLDLEEYPHDKVEEAMALCPGDCITWEK